MIFLSAQPDDTYFIWQLEIQLKNFQSLGIQKNHIHIVIGYNPESGLKKGFEEFINSNQHLAHFFLYPDTRTKNKYISSIRPHLLKKHWQQFPFLKNTCVFYHDSDILLSRIPDIDVYKDNINYVSDTRSYLDLNYIISKSDVSLLIKMAELIGVNFNLIVENDRHVGGAQYILKNISYEFWDKVESDSEGIFNLLIAYNETEKQKIINYSDYSPKKIHAWYADMWAVLWNLWFFNRKVEIHEEMNFSWPTSPIEYWNKNSILHYAGEHEDKKRYFYKRDYIHHAPWYDDSLSSIPYTNCSYPIVQLIKERKQELDSERLKLKKYTLFFQESTCRKYFEKYFVGTEEASQNKIEVSNSIIIPYGLIEKIDGQLDNCHTEVIFTKIYTVDQIFTEAFAKVLNADILELNKGKFSLQNTSIILKIKDTDKTISLIITEEVFLLQ